ncbi:MAG: hypothetical protein RJB62_221 [Pseudomonadota bacterium]|jgi:hypothetical protein
MAIWLQETLAAGSMLVFVISIFVLATAGEVIL